MQTAQNVGIVHICINIQTKDANLNRSYLLNYAAYYKLKYLELHLKDLNRME